MTYFQNLNRLILKELELRADRFVASYDPDKPSVILIPGGMGSKLLQSEEAYSAGVFQDNPAFVEIWLDWPAILFGRLDELGLDPDEWDHDRKPGIASGEMNSILKSYDGTEADFLDNHINYTEFGYDWRRDVRSAAGYLRTFLTMIQAKARSTIGNDHNALARLTLFAHSMGGLVVKWLINELVEENEDTNQWFNRFVSVATPFYGTETQIYRYYRGEKLVNLLLGSTKRVAEMIATLPGPYGLLPAPRDVLEPRLAALALGRYPVRDDADDQTPVDPFSADGRRRFPKYADRSYLARARDMFVQVDKTLPDNLYAKFFHIRNNIRENDAGPLEWRWQTIDPETFEPGGPMPIDANGGAGDGTVPFWSARLPETPADQIYSLSIDTQHSALAEDPLVLKLVRDIANESAGPSSGLVTPDGQTTAGLLPRGQFATELTALVNDIGAGQMDQNSVRDLPAPLKRALMDALAIC